MSLRATEDDIRRTVPWTPFSDADAQAAITVRHHPTSVPAGTVFEVDVQVANLGGRVWPSGPDQEPKIRLSYHWFHGSEAVVFEGRRTLLPHPLAPNDATMMTCVVEAPDDYRSDARWALAFEVLTEGDRWFGIAASIDIEVSAGPRQRLLEAATESYVPLDEVMSLRRELAFVDPLSSFMDHHGVQDDPPVYHRTLFEAVAIEASTTEGAALGEIVRRYEADQPAHVLEFGSGSSTVLLAALAQRAERQGRTIVSVANNADEAERVRGLLRDRGLESFVQLIVAPIVEVDEGGLNLSCFDPEVIAAGLAERSPDLVVVKGPADVGGASRFPTLLIAQEHIEKSATFLVQDAWRDKELAAAERWSKCPGIQVDGIIPLPRGMLVGTIEPIP